MSLGLIEKLTNFLMPADESSQVNEYFPTAKERKPSLRVHSQQSAAALKVFVGTPTTFDDVRIYSEYIRSNILVAVNFEKLDVTAQQRMLDFLNGVCYIIGGSTYKVSEQVVLCAPAHIVIDRELYESCEPVYI